MTLTEPPLHTPPHVLVVEDQPLMRDTLVQALGEVGFRVSAAADGAQFQRAFERDRPDLVVVDWGLPDVEGTAIVARLRDEGDVGVVMLTGRGSLEQRLQGLEQGADAYLVKPVDWRELELTLRAILRRRERRNREDRQASAPEGAEGGVRFEPRQFRLLSPTRQAISLNAQECVLIEWLLRQPGEVVLKEVLMEALGAHGDAWGEARLAQTVSRLRRKIEAHCPGWQPLRTVHRVGYAFDAME